MTGLQPCVKLKAIHRYISFLSSYSFFVYFLQKSHGYLSFVKEGRETLLAKTEKKISILDANYGRMNRDTCLHPAMSNINCRAVNSLQIIKEKCNDKTECQLLAVSSEFGGDPCLGTHKYLQVKYRCQEM